MQFALPAYMRADGKPNWRHLGQAMQCEGLCDQTLFGLPCPQVRLGAASAAAAARLPAAPAPQFDFLVLERTILPGSTATLDCGGSQQLAIAGLIDAGAGYGQLASPMELWGEAVHAPLWQSVVRWAFLWPPYIRCEQLLPPIQLTQCRDGGPGVCIHQGLCSH